MHKKQATALMFLLVLLFSLVLAPTAVWGQEPLRVSIPSIYSDEFPYIQANVTVTDASGRIVRDLTAESFTLLEDGRNVLPSEVQLADPNKISLAVALVIDASGSMKGDPLEAAKQAAIDFVNKLGDKDIAAIVVFKETAEVVQDFTSDKQMLINAIQGIIPGTYTCLFDGTYTGIRETAKQKTDRRAVVVMTDGEECGNESCTSPCSIFDEDDCITKAKENNVPVHTIGFRENVVEAPLIRIAESTGGAYWQADIDDISQIYEAIAEQLKYEYVVHFESRLSHDRQGHLLTVDVLVGSATGQDIANFRAQRTVTPAVLRVPGISDGDQVDEPIDIVPEVISANPVDRLHYYINNIAVYTATRSPWNYTWDPEKVDKEENIFTVIAYDEADEASNSVQFTLYAVQPPPMATPSSGGGSGGETDYTLFYILGGIAAVLLIGGGVLAMARSKRQQRTCPICQRPLPQGMDECPFCARDAARGGPAGITPPTAGDAGLGDTWQATPDAPMAQGGAMGGQVQMGGGVPMGVAGTQPYQSPQQAGYQQPLDPTRVIRSAPQVSAWLAVEKGEHEGQLFRMESEGLTIGRSPNNHIVLTSGTVSGQHAKLKIEGKTIFIYDLGSTNGTFVNGKKVLKQALQDGNRITIGETTFVFKQTQVQGS